VFDWLFEGRANVYLLLAVAAAALLYLGVQTRRRSLLIAGGGVVVLMGVYFLLDRLVETGREQVRRKLLEMAEAVNARDTDRVMVHVSERFSSQNRDRPALRSFVDRHLRERSVDELAIGDVAFPDPPSSPGEGTLAVTFRARAHIARLGVVASAQVRATFGRDPDGQWRMTAFEVLNPADNTTPLPLP
jgi:hypothetical protein